MSHEQSSATLPWHLQAPIPPPTAAQALSGVRVLLGWRGEGPHWEITQRQEVQGCREGIFSDASPVCSSILNLPGESTLRRDFLRLQLANKERSEALRRQQLEQQQRENEEHKRQLLAERQKRIEEQKEQRRRLEEVTGQGRAGFGWSSRISGGRSRGTGRSLV